MDLLAPDYRHSALIIIDFQNDCILPGAPFEVVGSYDIFPKLEELTKGVRESGIPIIHVVRAYLEDGSNADLCRRELVQNGTLLFAPYSEGAEFPVALMPDNAPSLDWDSLLSGEFQQVGGNDWVMYKSRWGAFIVPGWRIFFGKKE